MALAKKKFYPEQNYLFFYIYSIRDLSNNLAGFHKAVGCGCFYFIIVMDLYQFYNQKVCPSLYSIGYSCPGCI
ncbi:hypothetical protein GCM10011346_15760 [Oceanobacillus neutriphilus]|uniref:Uncharacterized protein n=1 Tax=Oceanobacillus neutriphilus TaxID=531815 RepID=A0ABQ2NT28_9BACI|nr:hypothetical protein GCM10011346_15760 [Oceanobacillus neutriphilus]